MDLHALSLEYAIFKSYNTDAHHLQRNGQGLQILCPASILINYYMYIIAPVINVNENVIKEASALRTILPKKYPSKVEGFRVIKKFV